MARDRGLYTTILGTDSLPTIASPTTPLIQLIDE